MPKSQLPSLEHAIKKINWNEHLAHKSVDENCKSLMVKLETIIHSFMRKIKSKPGKRNHLPWINETIRSLMKQRDSTLKMVLKNKLAHETFIHHIEE